MRRITILFLTAAALALGAARPVHAIPALDVRIAKQVDGPYNAQGVRINIDKGEQKNVFLKIRNNDSDPQEATIQQDGNPGGYRLRFFKGSNNITQQVNSIDGYTFTAQGNAKKFRVNVKRKENVAVLCIEIDTFDAGDNNHPRIVSNDIPVTNCL